MSKSTDVIAKLSMFSELSKAELKKVDRLMTEATIKEGREFISEGDLGREAFFIIDGRATVRKNGKVVATLGPGDVIGEMSVIANMPRVASVTADTDLEVEVLSRREFASLLDEVPAISKKVMVGVIKRLYELEPGLAQ